MNCVDKTKSLDHFPSKKVTFNIVKKRSHWQGASCLSLRKFTFLFSVFVPWKWLVCSSICCLKCRKDEANGTIVLVQQGGCKPHAADRLPEGSEKTTVMVPRLLFWLKLLFLNYVLLCNPSSCHSNVLLRCQPGQLNGDLHVSVFKIFLVPILTKHLVKLPKELGLSGF